jgi:hypothetical protein
MTLEENFDKQKLSTGIMDDDDVLILNEKDDYEENKLSAGIADCDDVLINNSLHPVTENDDSEENKLSTGILDCDDALIKDILYPMAEDDTDEQYKLSTKSLRDSVMIKDLLHYSTENDSFEGFQLSTGILTDDDMLINEFFQQMAEDYDEEKLPSHLVEPENTQVVLHSSNEYDSIMGTSSANDFADITSKLSTLSIGKVNQLIDCIGENIETMVSCLLAARQNK